jgi:Prp8 binding protein
VRRPLWLVLWRTTGDCPSYAVIKGHGNAVLDVDWSWDGSLLFSASTDKYAAAWDAVTGERLKKLRGHTAVVNSVSACTRGPPLVVSGSDDATARVRQVFPPPRPSAAVTACARVLRRHVPATA